MMIRSGKKFLAAVLAGLIMCFAFASTASAAVRPVQDRIYGSDRYATAASISQRGWPNGSNYALVARGDDFADALCAGPLAKKYNAPILLTNSKYLPSSTLRELKRLKVRTIYIIGGTGAVSSTVMSAIKAAGSWTVQRIYGQDRFETSVNIAKKFGSVSMAVLATGYNYPDALSVSPVAASLGMPILLTKADTLPANVKSYLLQASISKTYVMGGTGVISDRVKAQVKNGVRLGGKDRYDTNARVLKEFKSRLDFTKIYLAVGNGSKGSGFADALSGSVLASLSRSPMVIAYKTLSSYIVSFMKSNSQAAATVIALGGTAVIPDSLSQSLFDVVALATINRITDPHAFRTAIESPASGLSISTAASSAYGKLSDGSRYSVALDLLSNRPQSGFASNTALKKVFDRLVVSRTIISSQLKVVNDAAASGNISNLKALGCSFITNVRMDLQAASATYSKIDNVNVSLVVSGLKQAEDAFNNSGFTQSERNAMYNAILGRHFDSYREMLSAINNALPERLKVSGL